MEPTIVFLFKGGEKKKMEKEWKAFVIVWLLAISIGGSIVIYHSIPETVTMDVWVPEKAEIANEIIKGSSVYVNFSNVEISGTATEITMEDYRKFSNKDCFDKSEVIIEEPDLNFDRPNKDGIIYYTGKNSRDQITYIAKTDYPIRPKYFIDQKEITIYGNKENLKIKMLYGNYFNFWIAIVGPIIFVALIGLILGLGTVLFLKAVEKS